MPPYTNQIGTAPTGNEGAFSAEGEGRPRTLLSVPAHSATYDYDPLGNRTTQTVDSVTRTFTYNACSQLISEEDSGQTVEYEYDDWGNMTTRTVTGTGATTESFGYNFHNLMNAYANSATGASWQYDYWPTGERLSKTDLDEEESEIYIPRFGDVVTDYTQSGSNPASFQSRYVQGVGIDSKSTRITGATRRHYLGDMVGTVSVALDDQGNAAETVVRNAWGQIRAGSSGERYGFAQREHDMESGLVHMRHRMYDPRNGRFTQVDPLRRNRPFEHYRYAANNPVRMADPLGLFPQDPKCETCERRARGETNQTCLHATPPTPVLTKAWRYFKGFLGFEDSFEAMAYNDFKREMTQAGGKAVLEPLVILDDIANGNGISKEKLFNRYSIPVQRGVQRGLAGASKWEIYWGANKDLHISYWLGRFPITRAGVGVYSATEVVKGVAEGNPERTGENALGLMLLPEIPSTLRSMPRLNPLNYKIQFEGVVANGGNVRLTYVGKRGTAPEFYGGEVTETQFTDLALKYLGEGATEAVPGSWRFVSKDGLRQVRFGDHETSGANLHGHFEAYDVPSVQGGGVIENTWVRIVPDPKK